MSGVLKRPTYYTCRTNSVNRPIYRLCILLKANESEPSLNLDKICLQGVNLINGQCTPNLEHWPGSYYVYRFGACDLSLIEDTAPGIQSNKQSSTIHPITGSTEPGKSRFWKLTTKPNINITERWYMGTRYFMINYSNRIWNTEFEILCTWRYIHMTRMIGVTSCWQSHCTIVHYQPRRKYLVYTFIWPNNIDDTAFWQPKQTIVFGVSSK